MIWYIFRRSRIYCIEQTVGGDRMDQRQMIDHLRRHPELVQSVMNSRDGQRLMQCLRQGGGRFQEASQQAEAGNTAEMLRMLQGIMSTPDGAALLRRLTQQIQQ